MAIVNDNTPALSAKGILKAIGVRIKGVWLALIGKQIIPTDRKDWTKHTGYGSQSA